MNKQNLFSYNQKFKLKKKAKPVEELDKNYYILEVKQLTTSKNIAQSAEIAEIPFGLGRSEKFENKPQIFSAFTELGFINEKTPELSQKTKQIQKEFKENPLSPISVEHLFYRKIMTPYSPGVVRIKRKDYLGYDSDKKSSLLSSRQSSSPQPGISTKSTMLELTRRSMMPVCIRTSTNFNSVNKSQSPMKKSQNLSRVIKSNNPKFEEEEEDLKSYLRSPDVLEYHGNYLHGQKEGFGKILFKNGDKFKGFLKKNKKEGGGTFFYAKFGMELKGEFKDDLPHGFALVSFKTGDIFRVNFVNGKLEDNVSVVKYKDGSEYDGELHNGRRHGIGKMEYVNGGCYTGKWFNDQRKKYGTLTCKGFMFFEGTFFGDFTDGPGVLVRKDIFHPDKEKIRLDTKSNLYAKPIGSINKKKTFEDYSEFPQFKSLPLEGFDLVFITLKAALLEKKIGKSFPDGKFSAGRLQGAGMAKYGFLGVYYGNFLDGKRSGFGRMKYTDPEHLCEWFGETEGEYIGEWKDDKRHGTGKMTWPNGMVYLGGFNSDRRHRVIGKINFLNNDIYEGGWIDDCMEGSCMLYRNGMTIKGQFKSGVLTNLASLYYPDGRVYKGEIYNFIPHGSGEMKWTNGNSFVGEFCEGVIDGTGTMSYSNGDVYEGNWENGSRNGKGVYIYFSTKERFEGEWVEDKKSGEGCLKSGRGEVIKTGYWSNDINVV